MSDPTNGKTDKPRNPGNVNRPYRDVDIDWSKDAKGNKRTIHNNGQAMPQADEFSGYIKCETAEDCEQPKSGL